MKNSIFSTIVVVMFSMVTFTSCNKTEVATPDPTPVNDTTYLLVTNNIPDKTFIGSSYIERSVVSFIVNEKFYLEDTGYPVRLTYGNTTLLKIKNKFNLKVIDRYTDNSSMTEEWRLEHGYEKFEFDTESVVYLKDYLVSYGDTVKLSINIK